MNELVVRGEKIDLLEVVSSLTQKAKEFSSIEVDSHNYLYVESQRKELTAIIDTYTRVLEESEEEYLTPYKNLVEPLKNALDDILVVEKNLKDAILNEKKKAFKEEVRAEFYQLCTLACKDGVIPDFEEIYDEKWYNKPKKTWRELLIKKIEKKTTPDREMTAFIVIESYESVIKEIKEYLYSKNITFRFEEVKGE